MGKQEIRERIWDELEESGEARFPFPPHGRIPNFAGAEDAADRLATRDLWDTADVIKSNPDSPQRPVRRRALNAGKLLYMAVPRLREAECFLRLDPEDIDDIDDATTVSGSAEAGEPVSPEMVEPVDLIVAGSVAVDRVGTRIGKGEGYSDLEFAILHEFDRVGPGTDVVTTVHQRQVLDGPLPRDAHDVSIDLVCTPHETIEVADHPPQPTGIDWSRLTDADIEAMPVLADLQQ